MDVDRDRPSVAVEVVVRLLVRLEGSVMRLEDNGKVLVGGDMTCEEGRWWLGEFVV